MLGAMTDHPTAGQLLVRLAQAIDAQDWAGLDDLLAPQLACRYVHTGEVFDRDGFVSLNRDYPGSWRFEHESVVDDGEQAAMRARVSDGSETFYVASFARAASGRLEELVEVWTDSVQPHPERSTT